MLFNYTVIDKDGNTQNGTIDAITIDVAINSLQKRGLVISSIIPVEDAVPIWQRSFTFLERVSNKDVVIISRQIATLFEAQVSALRVFRLLASETEKPKLRKIMDEITSDLQGGSTISKAMSKHPEVFSVFYTSMVKAGEESGKLSEIFNHLADYIDRNYEVAQKAKNALIYPGFVIFTFMTVMILMLTLVIPKISQILLDSGQEIPIYTQVVISLSNFFVNYGLFLAGGLFVAVYLLFKFVKTEAGAESFDTFKINIPFLGDLYRKLYLSRIADNLDTMLTSGIAMIKALELTTDVVDNKVFQGALYQATERVKGGSALSDSLAQHEVMPNIMIQMMKVGEETGKLGDILATLANFYRREVNSAVDTLVDLIEPAMIVLLGLGVGTLLASVLIPIYNISATF